MSGGVRYTVFVLFGFVALVTGLFAWRITAPRPLSSAEVEQHGAFLYPQPRALAPFTLTDARSQPVDQDSLKGQWDLLFFGFTNCPDVCPTTLAVLRQAVSSLRERGHGNLQVWLVSVDPERDEADTLRQYLDHFDAGFRGIRGGIAELESFARQLNAVFVKVPVDSGRYTVDHSAHVAIVDPLGHFAGFFRAPLQASGVQKVMPHLMQFAGR